MEATNAMLNQTDNLTTNAIKTKKINKQTNIPRGKPKSKRLWKTPKTKFSNIKKTVPRLTLSRKQQLRDDLLRVKEQSRSIKEERKQLAIERRQRRLENSERRLENERRAEIVQIIKNPSKLKRLKKKQMRMIEKRDLSKIKVV